MTDDTDPRPRADASNVGRPPPLSRDARLAAALRENLRRRKDQARARTHTADET